MGNISPASYTVIELSFHTNSFLSTLKGRERQRRAMEWKFTSKWSRKLQEREQFPTSFFVHLLYFADKFIIELLIIFKF